MNSARNILVIGANPAWQKTLIFSRLRPGEVNRAESIDSYPAGKGVNFCRAARCHGRNALRLFQFAGGDNGRRLKSALLEEGIAAVTIPVEAETRCCTTCLDRDSGTMTELIEPSFPIPATAAERLLTELEASLPEADGIAVCGTLPSGSDYALYRHIAELARAARLPVLFDVSCQLDAVLAVGGTIILKINAEEVTALTGCASVQEGIAEVRRRWPGIILGVTAGAAAAYLDDGMNVVRLVPPQLDAVESPLGCGDTASAVLLSEYLAGQTPSAAFAAALAAAAANCLTPRGGNFRSADCDRFREMITVNVVRMQHT